MKNSSENKEWETQINVMVFVKRIIKKNYLLYYFKFCLVFFPSLILQPQTQNFNYNENNIYVHRIDRLIQWKELKVLISNEIYTYNILVVVVIVVFIVGDFNYFSTVCWCCHCCYGRSNAMTLVITQRIT